MGASRGPLSQAGQKRELTTQEQARRDWIHEQRGTKPSETPDHPRMAGSKLRGLMGGLFNAMGGGRAKGRLKGGGVGPYRSREVQDWIDTQRGVDLQPRDNQSSLFRNIFGMSTTGDRQRYQDRNAWIDEQIRKGKLELPDLKPEEVE